MVQVCEIEPGCFRDCDALVRNLQGRLDMLAVSAQMKGDAHVDQYEDTEEFPLRSSEESSSSKGSDLTVQLSERLKKQNISAETTGGEQVKQSRCSTCDAVVGDAKQYREHFKTEWHKHNLKRKTRQLPPLSAEECMADMELGELNAELKEYSF